MSQAVTLKPQLETAPTKGSIFVPVLFALTLFVSATLLFLVQPMIAKMILPFLGGSPAVWNTCQVFFQAVLLVGYTYAHVSTGWMGANKQGWLHLIIMFIPLTVLPLSLRNWEPPAADPIGWLGWLFLLLAVSVGLPFFILSTTAPLMQKWFTETGHPSAKDPYFLYAASNVGSMLALLGYPSLVEPFIPLRGDGSTWVTQINLWAIGYCILLALLAACRLTVARSTRAGAETSNTYKVVDSTGAGDPADGITIWTRLRWIALAFVPSSLMLGITTYLTLDIAAIPLLWVIPLSIYLLTFILVFARWPTWMHEGVIALMPLVVLLIVFMLETDIKPITVFWTIGLFLLTLFIVSLMCHGELARTKPVPRRLTEFYLLMSLGGVLGGMFNGLLAPLIFGDVIEHEIAMILACFLLPTLGGPTKLLTERIFGARQSKARGIAFDVVAGLFVGGALYAVLVFNATAGGGEKRPNSYKLWQYMESTADKTSSWIITGASWSKRKYNIGRAWVNESILRKDPMAVAKAPGEGESPFLITPYRVKIIFMYGTLILLCYAFATRPLRFGIAITCFVLASRLYDRGLTIPYLGSLPGYVNQPMYQSRSFFGVLRVDKEFDPEDDFPLHSLLHGTTLHGKQYTNPARQNDPITYYFRRGPVGLAFRGARENFPEHMNIAVIGLGTGTTASYGQKGDTLTYYEIDDLVRRIATNTKYFTFLENCERRGCPINIIMGDARLRLKDAKDGAYDVIMVDAFSSDAIPIHLITKQAVELYLQKLAPHGYLLIHVSNRYLRLAPVVGRIAEDLGVAAVRQHDDSISGPEHRYKTASDWIVVTRDKADLKPLFDRQPDLEQWSKAPPFVGVWPVLGYVDPTPRLQNFIKREKAVWETLESEKGVGLWTDDYSNLLQVLQW